MIDATKIKNRLRTMNSPEANASINRGAALTEPEAAPPQEAPQRQVGLQPVDTSDANPPANTAKNPSRGNVAPGVRTDPTFQSEVMKRLNSDQTQYYGVGGNPYNPTADPYSYWQSAGTWYKGAPSGQISVVGDKAPWNDENVPGVGSILEMIQGLDNGSIVDQLMKLQSGQLNQETQQGVANRQQMLSDRLGSQGVFGGVAQDALGQQMAAGEEGLANGLAGIQEEGMRLKLQNKLHALDNMQSLASLRSGAGLQSRNLGLGQGYLDIAGKNQDLQKWLAEQSNALNWNNLDLSRLNLDNSSSLTQRGQDMNLVMSLLTLAQQVEGEDRDSIMQLVYMLLNGSDDIGD